ncbi:carbamoyltransferase [Plantactinospora sp. KLBMP9567]|uniref:carbamoyltransferase family protein n=1 Tax=Plantactinospora sp. KLBMP9567 TaxID=3085900 RepID=UPI002980C70F|nr:carbamoyltransferase C-terminal domain-containing protein [Plantactinospora sp. KLBMP9567]MDW5327857.1 carbamoyltransferase C-terminal domain-containing protein [Plantactinospora sp. KLBMP9567]
MRILGLNMGVTRDGSVQLKDGAAALVEDGRVVVAVAEERLSRSKHMGGADLAFRYCLDTVGLAPDDLDMLVISTCSEPAAEDGYGAAHFGVAAEKVRAMPSHHLSHAASAFFLSPFEGAAIAVLDNEGNLLGEPAARRWHSRFERNSYYLGQGHDLRRLSDADDGLDESEIGPGEVYRHFTYYLGWRSYVYAGKTMGLAAFGRPGAFGDVPLFTVAGGKLRTKLPNGHDEPTSTVRLFCASHGVDLGPPRRPDEALTQRHADIARLVQDALEEALVAKLRALRQLTGSDNLCLAGGVALNCVANRRILDETGFRRIFVSSAPGDTGQSIGNAMWGWHVLAGQKRFPYGESAPAQLGRVYPASEILAAVRSLPSSFEVGRSENVAAEAAALVAAGYVIGWFQGGSELGPRALGGRSMVADPRRAAMPDYLNLVVKRRESFRPFAPSVLEHQASKFFDLPQNAPYMEFTAAVLPEVRPVVPAIVHIDGTARLQTVPAGSGIYAALIEEFERITGVPMVLNTSFNLGGESIVETPADAVDCFARSLLDRLVIGDFIVRRQGPADTTGFDRWGTDG